MYACIHYYVECTCIHMYRGIESPNGYSDWSHTCLICFSKLASLQFLFFPPIILVSPEVFGTKLVSSGGWWKGGGPKLDTEQLRWAKVLSRDLLMCFWMCGPSWCSFHRVFPMIQKVPSLGLAFVSLGVSFLGESFSRFNRFFLKSLEVFLWTRVWIA